MIDKSSDQPSDQSSDQSSNKSSNKSSNQLVIRRDTHLFATHPGLMDRLAK